MRFFLDNCLSPRYAESLDILSANYGHSVTHLGQRFGRNVTDQYWIRELRSEGDWVIVSGDSRIATSPPLKAIWLESGLTAFFLDRGWMNIRYWEQIALLVKWWPEILHTAQKFEAGSGFVIPCRGHRLKIIR